MHRRTLFTRLAAAALGLFGWRLVSAQARPQDPPPTPPPAEEDDPDTWQAFELEDLLEERTRRGGAYLSFLKSDSLSTGIYHLPAGATDGQSPHREDEVYHILKGEATLFVDGHEQAVKPGSTVYVRREAVHRFHTIKKDLTVLVFFAAAPAA